VDIRFGGLLIRAVGDMRNFGLAPTVHFGGDFHQDLRVHSAAVRYRGNRQPIVWSRFCLHLLVPNKKNPFMDVAVKKIGTQSTVYT
jgi:hypothetical protein